MDRSRVAGATFHSYKYCLLITAALSLGEAACATALSMELEAARAQSFMMSNVSPPDAKPGVIVASPSRVAPDYYFHWIRDSALTAQALIHLQQNETEATRAAKLLQQLKDFVAFTRAVQRANAPTGLGEPKFTVDGAAFTGPWARPQNDGPALRAIALSRLSIWLLDHGDAAYVRENLYAGEYPATTAIKIDLEYVAHHWRESSFDLWEESRGDHFYTRLAQRRALVDGADLADRVGDHAAAGFYRAQARDLETEIGRHWDPLRGIVLVTLNRVNGIDYKDSGLDMCVILASLHASRDGDAFFAPSDDRILATAARLQTEFGKIYAINGGHDGAVAIGRYPEDRYDGVGTTSLGNPWFIGVHAFAELSYVVARDANARGWAEINETNRGFYRQLGVDSAIAGAVSGTRYGRGAREFDAIVGRLRERGDEFMRLSLSHMDQSTGSMSEQFNRGSGYMQGAVDLTWSYASYLAAFWAR